MSNLQYSNIYLQVASLFFVMLIMNNYIKKRNTLTFENLIYSCLIGFVTLDLCVNIESTLMPNFIGNQSLMVTFQKIDMLIISGWLLIIVFYTFALTSPRSQGYVSIKENKELPYFKKVALIFVMVFLLLAILLTILPLNIIDIDKTSLLKQVEFTWRINLMILLIWLINIIYFVILKLKKKETKVVIKNRLILSAILYSVAIFLVLMLKSLEDTTLVLEKAGAGLALIQTLYFICVVTSNLIIITNAERITIEKYISLIIVIPLLSLVYMLEIFYPGTISTVTVATFVTIYMYYSIENPDLKLIEELNENRVEADQANLQKTRFLSNMSHEIRTPLNAIIGFSQALKEENISKEARDEVDDIIMSSNNLLDIVNGILDISKIEANKLEIEEKEYDSAQMFKEIVALAKARLASKPIDFRINIDASIPPVLYGDYLRVKQVIINLLTNSIKYTREGFIDFNVTHTVHDDKALLNIVVRDSGIGIKEEDLGKLFTKFQRLDLEKNASTEGTGLGLAITKSLIEIMGGTITVKSEYGKGSEFNIKLDQPIVHKTAQEIKKVDEVATTIEVSPDKKVIVVDDNKVNLKVASRLLKDYNIDPVLVESGEDCINMVKNGNHFDLILMDDMMPKMTGTEAMKILKGLPNFDTPVVVLTANAISGMRDKYLQAGFDEYLAKPINREHLSSIINFFLNTTTQHTTLEFSGRNEYTKVTSDEENKSTEIELPKESEPVKEVKEEIELPKETSIEEPKVEEKIETPIELPQESHEEPKAEEQATEELPQEQPQEETKEEKVEETTEEVAAEPVEAPAEVADKHTKEFLESKGVDVDHGLELLGDMETYEMILDEFLNNIDERLQKLTDYKDQKDMPNYAIEVHALKSDAKYLGCMNLADIAYKYEMASKENKVEEVEEGFEGLKEETLKVVNIIKEYLGK